MLEKMFCASFGLFVGGVFKAKEQRAAAADTGTMACCC